MNAIAKVFGLWGRERGLYRFHWGEISWKAGIAVMWWPGAWLHINLAPVNLFLHDPRAVPDSTPWDGPQYGFSWEANNWFRTLHVRWGKRSKVVWMPWCWKRVRNEYLAADGSWKTERPVNGLGELQPVDPTDRWEQDVKYRYCLGSFEIQEVVATYRVGRSEWRWRALPWLPWPSNIQQAIDVEFSAEVGERAGSWKGGTVGCGYTMRKNETPLECLRRMERERKF